MKAGNYEGGGREGKGGKETNRRYAEDLFTNAVDTNEMKST